MSRGQFWATVTAAWTSAIARVCSTAVAWLMLVRAPLAGGW
ncbi:hypothetical protein [Mycobacterium sp. TY815]|nr:hypothetical protein [Mycobacterium sp. TY815]MDP7703225.1 hypothetical protein [Mycobacterium sp. TY815]